MSSIGLGFRRLVGFFLAGAPVLALVLILAGLYATDRILVRSGDARIAADASLTAARIEKSIAIRVATLGSFNGLLVVPDSASRGRLFTSAVRPAMSGASRFARIRVASADTSIVLDTDGGSLELNRVQTGSPDPVLQLASAIDRVHDSRQGMVTPVPEVKPGQRGIAIIVPIIGTDSVVGTAIGIVLPEMLAADARHGSQSEQSAPDLQRRLLVTALSPLARVSDATAWPDTIMHVEDPRPTMTLRSREALIELPTGERWKLQVVHKATGWPARLALWGIGLAALCVLAIASLREREQSRRITERSEELEHLSTELLHANRAKSEFLANVSHELRTPLNAIVGFVDLLRDGVYGELAPRQVSPVERIAGSATHLRHLVDQVLDLAKITAGRLEIHTDAVDLRVFILSVASEMESLITERGLALSLAVGATLPRLRTDPSHLRQILVNLIGNAIKYTNAGTVSVRARLVGVPSEEYRLVRVTPDGKSAQLPMPPTNGAWVAIQVVDTGIGIAQVDQVRIFDEFEQVGAGPRGDSMRRGTGLGLSISRRLARLLGGDIVVESELARGSTFTLWLPLDLADLRPGDRVSVLAPSVPVPPGD